MFSASDAQAVKRLNESSMVRLTREYIGGMLAGVGIGILLYSYFVVGRPEMFQRSAGWLIAAFLLIAIGSTFARTSQRKPKKRRTSAR